MHCVIREVDFSLEVVHVKLVRSSADVALLVPISLENPVEMAHHHIMANIELASFVQERTVDVELDDKCLLTAILVLSLFFDDGVKLIDLVDDRDAVAPIGQLSGLDYPYIPHDFSHCQTMLLVTFLLSDEGLPLLMISQETFVLGVALSFADVKGKGDGLEQIATNQIVVLL